MSNVSRAEIVKWMIVGASPVFRTVHPSLYDPFNSMLYRMKGGKLFVASMESIDKLSDFTCQGDGGSIEKIVHPSAELELVT